MIILLRDSSIVPLAALGSVVAIGNFDGLHLGHHAVIEQAVTLARQMGCPAMVMTFEPHPRRLFQPSLAPLRLLPWHQKLGLLDQLNVDYLRVIRFKPSFAALRAEEFIENILVDNLRISHVVTGDDFVFGHQRKGNIALLAAEGKRLGFTTTACPPVTVNGERCSSSTIRELLSKGKMEHASQLLGRAFSVNGRVTHGDHRGHSVGFPTANLRLPHLFLPATGVYAVQVKLRDTTRLGVANLGTRPTFDGTEMRLETHIFDWDMPIYGEYIEVALLHHLRPEQKFSGIDALKEQIALDCLNAKKMLVRY